MTSTASLSDRLPAVHLFNPANDEALGSNNRWHTPSRHALQYQHDCELLPIWWANDGDFIIAPHHSDEEIKAVADEAQVNVRRYPQGAYAEPTPWGWSRDAKRQFEEAGVPATCLPTDDDIQQIRTLSHRQLAVDVNNDLYNHTGISAPNRPRLYSDTRQMEIHGGDDCLLKRPWSCSGRGVFPTSTLTDAELIRLAGGIIKRQGSVVVEDALPKALDMSALFYADDAKITHLAWSLFQTMPDGRYIGSLVAPQAEIANRLHEAAIFYGNHKADFTRLSDEFMEILHRHIPPMYKGWIGVDMLAYHSLGKESRLQLAPCIEINLRMTMGIVATLLANKLQFANHTYLLRTIAPGMEISSGSRLLAGSREGGFSVIIEPATGKSDNF